MAKPEKEGLVTLKISGSISYEAKIAEALAVRIIGMCVEGNPGASLSPSLPRPMEEFSSRESIAEYMIRVGANRNTDKILAIANYLQEKNGKGAVSPQEIKIQFRDAGETPPANFTRDFNDVTSSGWMAPEPSKKGYYWVTRTGKAVIDQNFEKALVKRSNKARSRTRSQTQKKKSA